MPIIKDKLFIFGYYGGYREATPENASYHTVPKALMRTGRFLRTAQPGPHQRWIHYYVRTMVP
jgi:hypothetical protein